MKTTPKKLDDDLAEEDASDENFWQWWNKLDVMHWFLSLCGYNNTSIKSVMISNIFIILLSAGCWQCIIYLKGRSITLSSSSSQTNLPASAAAATAVASAASGGGGQAQASTA